MTSRRSVWVGAFGAAATDFARDADLFTFSVLRSDFQQSRNHIYIIVSHIHEKHYCYIHRILRVQAGPNDTAPDSRLLTQCLILRVRIRRARLHWPSNSSRLSPLCPRMRLDHQLAMLARPSSGLQTIRGATIEREGDAQAQRQRAALETNGGEVLQARDLFPSMPSLPSPPSNRSIHFPYCEESKATTKHEALGYRSQLCMVLCSSSREAIA